jgi:hypothetical protein
MAALLDDLWTAAKVAVSAGWQAFTYEWAFRRHLRRGGCPDELPF